MRASFEIAVEAHAPIEIRLLATALRARSEAKIVANDEGDASVMRIRSEEGTLQISSHAGEFIVERGEAREVFPWFLPVPLPGDPIVRGKVRRVGIAGGADERRLRMSWRTVHELRVRSMGIVAVLLGTVPEEMPLEGGPDEGHGALDVPEYLSALRSLDLVLECTDRFGSESFLAIAARDAGVPVVTHADRPDLAAAADPASSVWSADGFAEAVQTIHPGSPERLLRPPAAAMDQLLQRISGA